MKKLMCMLVTGMLAVGMLTGCGSSVADTTTDSATDKQTEAAATDAGTDEKDAASDFDAKKTFINEQVEMICNRFPVYGEF